MFCKRHKFLKALNARQRKAKKKPVPVKKRSERAGLIFPIGKVFNNLRDLLKVKTMDATPIASVYLAATLESFVKNYLTKTLPVKKKDTDDSPTIVMSSTITNVLGYDSECNVFINALQRDAIIFPHIYQKLYEIKLKSKRTRRQPVTVDTTTDSESEREDWLEVEEEECTEDEEVEEEEEMEDEDDDFQEDKESICLY